MSHPGATATDRHKVVIIGSGFGGLNAAKALKRADVDIKMIARTTHHLFQPLLYQVATGIISSGEIAPPTRIILRKQKNVQVLLGNVTHIDLANQTVKSELLGHDYVTPYDTLIVAAGAGQSYFGNDHFAEWAPGMKTVDDALELRGRILGAFEQAERSSDPARREKLLTFTVVGAGPTGVEMAGQIAELADHTLKGAFRHIDSTQARVILLDAAPAVLPPMGEKLGNKAKARLEKMGVEIQLGAMVTDVDRNGITVKDANGIRRIESSTKVWSAGVSASPLGRDLAEQSEAELDRAGRVKVLPDLTIPGYPNVFVVGDMAAVEGVPGMAQGAIQGAHYATKAIKHELKGQSGPADRKPFKYFDKGSMATVSRFSAVAQVGKFEFGGFLAWLAWLVLHLYYLIGHRNRIAALFAWGISFLGRTRGQMAITSQMIYARLAMNMVKERADQGALAAAEHAEEAERQAG
jgi:NADH dehydrogenase